tara:strand:- start:2245 stop:2616 length:372 start_codon:yes stop_codon:yes gene_type:complete
MGKNSLKDSRFIIDYLHKESKPKAPQISNRTKNVFLCERNKKKLKLMVERFIKKELPMPKRNECNLAWAVYLSNFTRIEIKFLSGAGRKVIQNITDVILYYNACIEELGLRETMIEEINDSIT